MTDYVKNTDYAAKDNLLTGNPAKLVKGAELDTEFNDIVTAIATKADSADIANMLETSDIGVTVQAYDATILVDADIGVSVAAQAHTHSGVYEPADATILKSAAIGVSVQGYDADTAKTDVTQTFTVPQRATVTTDNDLSFDLNATNNFSCTPTAGGTLTFTNIAAGQSGFILLTNGSNYAIAAHTNTKITATDLAKISATGTYVISYFSNGTNVYCVVGGAF